MDSKTVSRAIKEAERFISVARELEQCHKDYPRETRFYADRYAVKSAAVKRASMDLTRVLADMRQGR